jgi:DNA-binding response OmpR family regulator
VLFQADGLDSALAYFQPLNRSHSDLHPNPALVLLDYDLGGGQTGCNFLQWFRKVKKNNVTPVVMLSGSQQNANVAQCYAMGANRFLVKPHTMERFKAIVSMLFISLANPGAISLLPEYIPDPTKAPPRPHFST